MYSSGISEFALPRFASTKYALIAVSMADDDVIDSCSMPSGVYNTSTSIFSGRGKRRPEARSGRGQHGVDQRMKHRQHVHRRRRASVFESAFGQHRMEGWRPLPRLPARKNITRRPQRAILFPKTQYLHLRKTKKARLWNTCWQRSRFDKPELCLEDCD